MLCLVDHCGGGHSVESADTVSSVDQVVTLATRTPSDITTSLIQYIFVVQVHISNVKVCVDLYFVFDWSTDRHSYVLCDKPNLVS